MVYFSAPALSTLLLFLDASDLTKEEKVYIFQALFWNIILLEQHITTNVFFFFLEKFALGSLKSNGLE